MAVTVAGMLAVAEAAAVAATVTLAATVAVTRENVSLLGEINACCLTLLDRFWSDCLAAS